MTIRLQEGKSNIQENVNLSRAKAPSAVASDKLSPLYPKAKDIGFYGATHNCNFTYMLV